MLIGMVIEYGVERTSTAFFITMALSFVVGLALLLSYAAEHYWRHEFEPFLEKKWNTLWNRNR